MDETWADEFGLNYAQMRFVQNAVPGNDRAGYSEALVGVDGEWRGIEISALPTEKEVIDYEPGSHGGGSTNDESFTTPTDRLRNDGGHT
nr:hypothetical protein [Halomicrobium zhouii]